MKNLVVGIGCRKGTTFENLENEIMLALRKKSLSMNDVKMIASIDIKKEEKGILELIKKYNLEFKTYSSEELSEVSDNFYQSSFVQSITGTGNVCESAAYLASGKGKCILNKTIMDRVTISIYETNELKETNNILIIGGTLDSRNAAYELKDLADIYLSVATQYGADLVEDDDIKIVCGRMDAEGFASFMDDKNIDLVIDMSHPFALKVSEEIKKACVATDTILMDYTRNNISYEYGNVFYCNSFEEAANRASYYEGIIFLTIGANNVSIFAKAIDPKRIVARVLDMESSIKACLENGILKENIIAARGPFSYEEDLKFFSKYNASVIISKDSGLTGGVDKKIMAAEELNIPVILVEKHCDCDKAKISVSSIEEIREKIINKRL